MNILVATVTSLRAGKPGVRFLAGTRDSSLLQNVKARFRAHPAYSSMGIGVL